VQRDFVDDLPLCVVDPDSDMVWMWTADDAVDMIVKRSSALDDAAPWTAGANKADNPE
jgi:hypothetical protein